MLLMEVGFQVRFTSLMQFHVRVRSTRYCIYDPSGVGGVANGRQGS